LPGKPPVQSGAQRHRVRRGGRRPERSRPGACAATGSPGARRTAVRLVRAQVTGERDGRCWLRRVAGADRVAAAARAMRPALRQRAELPPTSGGCPLTHAATPGHPRRSTFSLGDHRALNQEPGQGRTARRAEGVPLKR